jgi:hypothetical protein
MKKISVHFDAEQNFSVAELNCRFPGEVYVTSPNPDQSTGNLSRVIDPLF